MFFGFVYPKIRKRCILLHIITLTKQGTMCSFVAAPEGDGAPDELNLALAASRERFVGLVSQVLVSEDETSGSLTRLSKSRARQIASHIYDLLLDDGREDS